MMKSKILFLAAIALAITTLLSCDKDSSAGLTRITYYPTLTILGDGVAVINKGDAYVDAGVQAELNGEDVSGQVEVSSNVNTANAGIYTVSYKITNADGFFATASRTVLVGDPAVTADISGTYTVDASSHREVLANGTTVVFGDSYDIEITSVTPGIFFVSDLFGGWYDQRADYGPAYAMTGYILLNADNSIELLSSHINGWGDSLDGLDNGSYNPGTDAIHWDVTYAGAYTWFIDLEKQ
jgi:hypothetical protein